MNRVLGVVVLAALAAHAAYKGSARLGEMLWMCHVASAVLAVGLLTGRRKWVAGGFVMHASYGFPSFCLDAWATGVVEPTGVAAHVAPLIAGAVALAGRPFPRGVVLPAWGFFTLFLPIAYLVTDPELNVNLAHRTWPPLAPLFPLLWMSWIAYAGAGLVAMALGAAVLRRLYLEELPHG